MGMKLGKKSKRTPTRLRAKIEKAGAAKQRKQRKLAKKPARTQNPEWRSRIKKDPGIPNSFPFKDKILAEIEERKRQQEEEKLRLREEARKARKEEKRLQRQQEAGEGAAADVGDVSDDDDDDEVTDEEMEVDESNPMAALLASARARAAEFTGQKDDDDDDAMDEDDMSDEDEEDGNDLLMVSDDDDDEDYAAAGKDSSRKQFDKVFKTVTQAADVVLYVLDARDPEGTRSRAVEREIMAADGGSKRLILVLNKIDLVPPAVLKGWLLHLRRSFPTLPLRAAHSAPNASAFDHKALSVRGTSETLFRALKSYAQSRQLKRAVSVGVIGYPNVGKSSVINALTARMAHPNRGGRQGSAGGAAACPTGAEAGVTTSLREVKLDSKLKLIDSPGIVFPSTTAPSSSTGRTGKASSSSSRKRIDDEARLVLLNAIPPKQISDPVPAVALLLQRFATAPELMQKMLDVYGIPPLMPSTVGGGDATHDFLVQVARKRGRLGKGGVPNPSAARATASAATPPAAAPGEKEEGSDVGASAAAGGAGSAGLQVDDSKPVLTLQIRLGDGTRLPARFNASHTVGDVYRFVEATRVQAFRGRKVHEEADKEF
ncbi:hypothetical protein KEM52_001127 [Ascosphaera acerosa]|nr:hypothetical protein KEM52_001127 [Ascosphaera acerosa]